MDGRGALGERIAALDVTLLEDVEAQLDREDRRSLLALHAACRSVHGSFSYLEIGSHLGGSLQVFVRDPACTSIVSIDPRPQSQPDERGIRYRYEDNSTERMLTTLGALDGADLGKLRTLESGTGELDSADLPAKPDLAFVDGEHTDRAAATDARFCAAAMNGAGCIAFHDAPVVHRALGGFLSSLERAGMEFQACLLPHSIFVVELGPPLLLCTEPLLGRTRESYKGFLRALELTDPYRAEYVRTAHRILRRLERLGSDIGPYRSLLGSRQPPVSPL